jgi:hypothetical protein
MCIRAIDYCPPVDITFGDFLRGVITADIDYAPDDTAGYRTVFIQSFREWGIHPRGVTSMAPDALKWPSGDEMRMNLLDAGAFMHDEPSLKQDLKDRFLRFTEEWNLESDRFQVWRSLAPLRGRLWAWLRDGDSYGRDYAKLFGLVIEDHDAPTTVYRKDRLPTVEVHAARPAIRRTLNGAIHTDLVVEITQRRRGYFDPAEQKRMDQAGSPIPSNQHGDFIYRAGCTILIDPATQEVRRVIRTPGTVANDLELERVRRFLTGETATTGNSFDAGLLGSIRTSKMAGRYEPFALLHQQQED